MEFVGIQTQIRRNNQRSTLLLIAFPVLIVALVFAFFHLLNLFEEYPNSADVVNENAFYTIPWILAAVALWFVIAWFSHTAMINRATGAMPLNRNENMRVYNLVENLCISRGMKNPKLFILEDESLNAYASGISESTFSITLSRGIINKLNDQELEGVIAHELTHIRNRDVRLLIVSIVFVGIFAFVSELALRSMRFSGGGKGKKNNGVAILLIIALALIGWLISVLFRFAISRQREYMADAGAVELTKNPEALASALAKVSQDPWIEAVKRDDVAQLFIQHPTAKENKSMFSSIFATHPPIEKRIQLLRQF